MQTSSQAAAPTSRSGTGLAPSRSVAEKINREVVLLLGWGRAILLQLAHPLVAAGVAEHSSFRSAPGMRLRRLRQTLGAMIDLCFGTPEEVQAAADGINAIHDRVHGTLPSQTRAYARGTPYDAHDPKLLAWVHATLIDSFLITYELYAGPLTGREKEQYCAEAAAIEPLLGIPEGYLPRSVAQLRGYMREMIEGHRIEVTETARQVAGEVVSPPTWAPLRPLLWLFHLPTRGLLPQPIQEAYGFRWGPLQQSLLTVSARMVRLLLRLLPPLVRHWPRARRFWFALLRKAEQLAS